MSTMFKTMNIGLKVIAWIGFAVFSLGTIIALMATIGSTLHPERYGVNFVHLYALVLAAIGTPLMLSGGIITRPKHFWLFSLIIGLLYIIGCIQFVQNLVSSIQHTRWDYLVQNGGLFSMIWDNLFILIPGIIIIAEGIWIWRLERRSMTKP